MVKRLLLICAVCTALGHANAGPNGKLQLFGLAQSWTEPSVYLPPDPLGKPVSQGPASGPQFPYNWWVDTYQLNWFQQNNLIAGLTYDQRWQTAIRYCASNNVFGPRIQLFYELDPGGGIDSYKAWLQKIATYIRQSNAIYQIACNEPFDWGGTDHQGGTLQKDLGGPGATGWDWLINLIKLQRQYLPSGVKLGLNETNCEYIGASNQQKYINLFKLLAQNGAPLDWCGFEGYWLEHLTTVAKVQAAVDAVASQVGIPVIFAESILGVTPQSASIRPS